MPPRPLQSVKRNATFAIYDDALRDRPALAVLIAYAITDWARVEANLGKALIIMLGANAKAAAAMYGSLKSPQAKADTFRAVAKVTLSTELFHTFDAVLIHLNKISVVRNRLAHGLWATSLNIPDALLVVEANDELARERDMTEFYWGGSDKIPMKRDLPKIHPKDVLVYFEKDLREEIKLINECFIYTQSLCSLAGGYVVSKELGEAEAIKIGLVEGHDRIHSWLCSQPPLQKILNRTKTSPLNAQ